MVQFHHVQTCADGPSSHLSVVSDMLAIATPAGVRLITATGPGGGLLLRDAGADMAVAGVITLPTGPILPSPLRLATATLDGHLTVLVAGQPTGGLTGYRVQPDGQLSAGFDVSLASGVAGGPLLALEAVELDGRVIVFTAARGTAGLTSWEPGSPGRLVAREQIPVAEAVSGNDILDLAQVVLGGQAHLLALSVSGNSLSNFRIGPSGAATLVDMVDMSDGLGIQTPTRVETVVSAGVSYALIGAAGSSSITVVALSADGRMRVTDQVNDDLESRFQGVSVLKTVVLDGQAFVLAGGADDGLTLMTLLPGGRLLALASLADDLAMGLTNPSAIDLWVANGRIEIAVAGEGAAGVTRLSVDPIPGAVPGQVHIMARGGGDFTDGAGSSQIVGGAGNDRLSGGAGNDILIDGAGTDRLTGGPGADVFVFTRDMTGDWIEDYERGIDRMDLSALARFYTVEALTITPTANGARIDAGDDWVQIVAADGRPLSARDFDIADLRGLWHVPTEALPDPDMLRLGTGLNDTLIGGTGNDTLIGGRGDDRLAGAGGRDLLNGETHDDGFDDTAAQVFRLYQATLGRAPDRGGHLTWVDRLSDGGWTLEQAASGFVGSVEFRGRYGGTDTVEFVTLLYANVLGRAPDPGGLATWTGRLEGDGWTRPQVVVGFSESLEFRNGTAADALNFSGAGYQADWSDDVFGLYQATLGRTPDEGGLLGWSAILAGGRPFLEVVGGFIASAEFRTRYGATTTAEQFVTLLYANVLARAPDPVGFASWMARLAGDWGRDEAVQGFAQSREFVTNTAPQLISWMRAQGLNDELIAGTGNDGLFGGILADSFVFSPAGTGRHAVADLEPWDWIDLSAFDYADVRAARAQMVQSGNDVVFADAGVTVIFHDFAIDAMHDGMFFL